LIVIRIYTYKGDHFYGFVQTREIILMDVNR